MSSRSRGTIPDHVPPSRLEGGLNDSNGSLKSETPCWTCRRRRVQCDGVLPTCLKCKKAGKECLGYKKPLVWNAGVASRGKMMGKTFHESKASLDLKKSFASKGHSCPASPQTTISTSASGTPEPHYASSEVEEGIEEISRDMMIPYTFAAVASPGGTLVDPIFQDLKPITRYYLDYFAEKLCSEAVLHDLPGQNPFRDLMSTVGSSPLLLKSMLAAAARHITNYTNSSISPSWSSTTPEATNQELQHMSHSSKYHAYYYKQIALSQLRKDLESNTGSGIENDIIVASISLFIWIDLLEAGKNTWRIHLEGMKKLMGLKDSYASLPNASSTSTDIPPGSEGVSSTSKAVSLRSEGYSSAKNTTAHPYFFDTCIIFDIMGTTLSRPYKISKPLPPTPTVQLSLLRAEKISFIGCPADLLWLIVIINWKCWRRNTSTTSSPTDSSPSSSHFTSTTEEDTHTNSSILSQIHNFDPISWAQSTTLCTPNPDTQERIDLASAYQNAVLIYFHRVLLPVESIAKITSLATSALTHLSHLPSTHPFIKAILWPTFISGAEISSPSLRDLTRHLLHKFWIGYRSVNVVNAAGVLEEMWGRCDALSDERREQLENSGFWSKGVLNFGIADVHGLDDGSDNGGLMRKDWLVGGDVDWLFV